MAIFSRNRRSLSALVATIGSLLLVSGCGPTAKSERRVQDNALTQAHQAYQAGRIDAAIRIWRELSEQGDSDAQFNIGLMYAHGTGVPQSDADAARWYRKAADQGLAQAQSSLAAMYTAGKGVPQDYVAAIGWYRKSADQGFAEAQFNLGVRYAAGLGVPQDYIQAHKWCNLGAAGASDPEVQIAAAACRSEVAAKIPAAKIMEAQRLASEWRPIKGAKISAYAEVARKPDMTPKVEAKRPRPQAPALPGELTKEEYEKIYGPISSSLTREEDERFFGSVSPKP